MSPARVRLASGRDVSVDLGAEGVQLDRLLREVRTQAKAARLQPVDYLAVSRALGALSKAKNKGGGGNKFTKSLSGVLNALSVPQAALLTTVHNLGTLLPEGLQGLNTGVLALAEGNTASDDPIPWASAAGAFHRDSEGRTGSERALEAQGITNPISKLAAEIVLDPLWLVGVGGISAAAKAARVTPKAVEAAVKAGKEGEDVGVVQKLLTAGARPKERYPTRPGEVTLPGRSSKGGARVTLEQVVETALRPIRTGNWHGGVHMPGAPRKWDPPRFLVRGSSPATPPKVTTVKLVKTSRGTFVGDRFFIRAIEGTKSYKVYRLAEAGSRTLKGAEPLQGTRSYSGAVKLAREQMLADDIAKQARNLPPLGPQAISQVPKRTRKAGDNIETAKGKTFEEGGGLLGNVLRTIETQGLTFAKNRATREGIDREVFLKLGIGRNAKHLRIPGVKLPEKTLGMGRGMMGLARSPIEHAIHQLRTQTSDLSRTAQLLADDVVQKFGKEVGLQGDELTAAGQRVGAVGLANNQSPEAAHVLMEGFRREGLWDERYDALLNRFQDHFRRQLAEMRQKAGGEISTDLSEKARGPYFPQAVQKEGGMPRSRFFGRIPRSSATEERKLGSAYAYMTEEQSVAKLVEMGMPEDSARAFVTVYKRYAPKEAHFAEEAGELIPELNAFTLLKGRDKAQMDLILDRQIEQLARDSGIFTKAEIDVLKGGNELGPLAASALGRGLQEFTAEFKLILTSINPAHFVRNVVGDYINRLINGGFRHTTSGAWNPKGRMFKLIQGDEEALRRTYQISEGVEMTGAELLVESSFMGLGRGYVGSDIAQMMDIYEGGLIARVPGVRKYAEFMKKLNVDREGAQRMETYIKWRKSGDDMFSAATKTLRVHFDYSDLNRVEKVMLRNVILFYTWLRKNTVLQMSGVMTRPALYHAAGSMEEARPKLEGEPNWVSRSMPIGLPGVGYLNVGNPMYALNDLPTNMGNMRKILGSINPALRLPIELIANSKWDQGRPIERWEGDRTPSLIASALEKIGVDLPYASPDGKRGGGPSLPSKWNYLFDEMLGPQWSTAKSMSKARDEETPGGPTHWSDWAGRISGVRRVETDAPQAARNVLSSVKRSRFNERQRRRYNVGYPEP